ncbi:MAG: DEAD/DEAH box helicase, partial [Bacteroidota bacterium]
LAVFGGANIVGQIKDLKKPHQVVVATPGRLIDLANRKAIKLDQIEYLILDEADEMLNMGFKEELDKILSFTPDFKTTWLFSATMPNEIKRIVKEYMVDPYEVRISAKNIVNTNIAHQYVVVKSTDKKEVLRRYLDSDAALKGIVFTRTKIDAQKLSDDLGREGYRVDALHGDLSQNQRDRVMGKFKADALQLLIATDVAARGIDVDNLSHVFHYAIPDQLEYYTHRSGRTARGGKTGISLAITTKRDGRRLGFLAKDLKISFEKVEVPTTTEIVSQRMQRWIDGLPKSEDLQGEHAPELQSAVSNLEKYSKEELIKILVDGQLDQMNLNRKNEDINDHGAAAAKPAKKRKDDSERPRKNLDGQYRYYINIGRMDGASTQDLVEFLVHESGLVKSDITDVILNDTHSFFQIKQENATAIEGNFDNLEIEGRAVRVDRDPEGKDRSSEKRSSRGRGGRSRNDRHKPYGRSGGRSGKPGGRKGRRR